MAGATAITHAKTRESAADAKHPVHSTARQTSSTAFHAAGNLQLQGVLSGGLLQGKLNGDNPDDPLQQKALEHSARPETLRNHGTASLEQNNRQTANSPRPSSSHSGFGSNLVSTRTEHGNAVTPVQTKCATCEAGEASTEEQPVQLWDCTDLTEPTCVQSKQAMAESPVQPTAEAEDKQREEEPVQAKCATCEAEDAAAEEEPVQSKCAGCDAKETGADQEAEQEPVQLWDCTDLTEPTCVQAKCTDCQDEEPVQQDRAKAPVRSVNLIHREAKHGLSNASSPLPHADRIQASFGHHDVSHVRSSMGGAAETANRHIGALAFTSGPRIAFSQSPDLHLAAHEAAHVIQQREGLSLPGNVGRAGDRWEQHADRVADAVVGGRSAEGLLDEVAKPNPSGRQVAASGASAAQEQVVQHRFTSSPAYLTEAPSHVPATAPEADQSKDKAKGVGASSATGAKTETGRALEAAGPGAGGEGPPEGIGVGGTPAAPEGAGMPGAAGGPGAPAGAGVATPGASIGAAGGGGINAPCYNVDPPPVPEETEEPSSDERSAQSEAEPQVTFDAWVDEPDQCPAETQLQQDAQQMPDGIGSTASAAPAATGDRPARAAPTSASGGASTMAEAASAPSEGSGQSAGSSISGAESARDVAVADFESATGALDAVLLRAGGLEQGANFVSGVADAQRDQATDQVRTFMQHAGAQITGAVAFAREQVPVRLGGMAEAIMASLQGTIESEKTAISGRIAQARMQARVAAQRARAHVHAEYAASITTVVAETSTALATLSTQHASTVEKVDQQETKALEDVNRRFAKGRSRHEDKGPEYARRAIARGQEHASQYERCKGNYSDDGFWDGCLTVRRAKAQQDAACKTAAGYKTTFVRTANKKGYDLLPLRTQYRCAVIAGARQVNKTLDDTYDKLVAGLEQGQRQAIEGLGSARRQNLAAIDKALNATLRALVVQEHTQRQAVNDAGYSSQLGIEQLAHACAANLARGVGAAMESLDRALLDLRTRLEGGPVPSPEALARTLSEVEATLGGGMGSFLATMETGASMAQAQIGQTGHAALGGLAGISTQNAALSTQAESGFTGTMNGLMAGSSCAFSQLTGNHIDQARKSATEGTTAMKQAAAGFVESLGTIRKRVDGAINISLEGLDGELGGKLAGLDGQIAREAWKAAEKEQPAWKKVVAIVLIIVVIIVAAVISIVTLGAGASLFAVILVGALVGAVSAGLIQILNNWASGEIWHEGLVTAMVMGAIGGAIGGGLGFAGGALASGAAAAGARAVTQLAITVTSDLVAEGLTQTVGYFAFGQQFNWQGFVMAGAMSGVSFRAHPSTPHPPAAHAPPPHAAAPHAPTPHANAPHPEAPHPSAPHAEAPGPAPHGGTPESPPPHPTTPEPPRPAAPEGVAPRAPSPAAARRGAISQVAGGALVGLGVELAASAITGEKLDPTRIASAAASAAVAARMSRMHSGGAPEPRPGPTTRAGRALERFRTFDPGGVGARLGERLEGLGGRMVGASPEAEVPAVARPRSEETSARPVEEPETARARGTKEPMITRPPEDSPESRPAPRPHEEVPENATRPRETIVEIEVPARVGNTDHHLSIHRGPNGAEVWVCSGICGPLKMRIEELLPHVSPGSAARDQLKALRRRANHLEARIEAGEIPDPVAKRREVERLTAQLEVIGQGDPNVGRLLDAAPGEVPEMVPPRANPDAPVPPSLRRGGLTDPRIVDELPPGQRRTPEETEAAREFFRNNERRAISWWEQRNGRIWPKDPETGEWAIAGHQPRALSDGEHPLRVEPEFGDPNREGTRVRSGEEVSDAQRWGSMRRNPAGPVKRITDPRIIEALPPGGVRTAEETARARSYYDNHRAEAIRRWEARTGETWPTNPRTGRPAEGNHTPRTLAEGAHPLDGVEPELRPSNAPHTERPEGGGRTDAERLGARGGRPRGL
ncbi:MAG: DUF4157 domain-containing protein [Nitrospira sp.]|nr:DUF4157 domain-containing protein [Nitrospira sp.]